MVERVHPKLKLSKNHEKSDHLTALFPAFHERLAAGNTNLSMIARRQLIGIFPKGMLLSSKIQNELAKRLGVKK
jgi:hypothetical protein